MYALLDVNPGNFSLQNLGNAMKAIIHDPDMVMTPDEIRNLAPTSVPRGVLNYAFEVAGVSQDFLNQPFTAQSLTDVLNVARTRLITGITNVGSSTVKPLRSSHDEDSCIGLVSRARGRIRGDCEGLMADAAPIHIRISHREWIVILLLVLSVVINYVDRSNLGLAILAASGAAIFIFVAPCGRTAVRIFLDLRIGTAFWAGGRVDRPFPRGVGAVARVPAVVDGHGFCRTDDKLCGTLRVATCTGAGRVGRLSMLFAHLCRHAAGAPRTGECTLIDAGTKVGPAAGAFFGGMVLVHWGWRMLFVVFGVGALVWMIPWYFAMPRGRAAVHSKPRAQERDAVTPVSDSTGSIAKMVRQRCAWGTTIGHFSGNLLLYYFPCWRGCRPTLWQEEHPLDSKHVEADKRRFSC